MMEGGELEFLPDEQSDDVEVTDVESVDGTIIMTTSKMIRHKTAQLDQKIQELERRWANRPTEQGLLITESQLDILHWKVLEEEMNTIIEELNILDTLIFLISRLLDEEPSRENPDQSLNFTRNPKSASTLNIPPSLSLSSSASGI
ncbi:hypothetical protein GCK72_011190 [Caenorhabditis remanei]|uniref:Uncharacterized protein n=1 Tax=Caenorhabditis remanei TaxID=31234 RepID=A0A6A5H7T5_CAERE|nr:hypothetical protein GCK72_011190 [Caenorhabditis remanei]KAF1762926.1 hypothetical protein GCK72_011190 [Caenorhabditis remanei]